MNRVLVTGGRGQLALSLQRLVQKSQSLEFFFLDVEDLDITDFEAVRKYIRENGITFCINCAAYTAVDLAESEERIATNINVEGPKNLAIACKDNNAFLIHISTDFVFDGRKSSPYTELDLANPLSVYGLTKKKGEDEILNIFDDSCIIRTSWLYSEFGKNFVKTMLYLADSKKELGVVCDQIGTPTYAGDLAKFILFLINKKSKAFGIYHFSNNGVASWFDFAKSIFEINNLNVKCNPIATEFYPTPAERPYYSVLNKSKVEKDLAYKIPYWRDSLKTCLRNIDADSKAKEL